MNNYRIVIMKVLITFSFLLMGLVASHAQDAPEANGLSSVAQTSPPANMVKASVGPGLIYSKAYLHLAAEVKGLKPRSLNTYVRKSKDFGG